MPIRRSLSLRDLAVVFAISLLPAMAPAAAQDFPVRPITWVVPYAPGGITDTNSRLIADEMSKLLGQTIIVDNRAGGGGLVGTEQVARSSPDGYTLIYATQGTMASNVSLKKNLPYDPMKSFVMIDFLGQTPNLLVASEHTPYKTVPELIAYAKQHPGKINYASAGAGTGTHLVAELFKTVAGIDMVHVPYKGSAPAINDLLGGRVDVMFDYPITVGPHAAVGKLKVLATTADTRLDVMRDVPTMAELGFTDMTTESWSGLMVPAGTPAPVVEKLAAATRTAMTSERVRDHLDKVGSRAILIKRDEIRPFMESEIKRWADVIAKAGIEKQ